MVFLAFEDLKLVSKVVARKSFVIRFTVISNNLQCKRYLFNLKAIKTKQQTAGVINSR